MIYTTTSVKEVIARINRTTRDKDASFFGDILEWIPEGINKLRTRYSVVPAHDILNVDDNVTRLPCGLVSIESIFYEGCKLPTSDRIISKKRVSKQFQTVFKTSIDKHSTSLLPGEIEAVKLHPEEYYKLQLDYIHTSFECGELELFYWKLPVDCDGYPLIVDDEDYKEALYWYVIMKMIEAGYKHSIFTWEHCWNMWENIYGPRALAKMKMPTQDDLERLRRGWSRMITPVDYHNNFEVSPQRNLEL